MDSTTTRKDAPAATKAANKPVKSFRLNSLSVSIFANKVKYEGREYLAHKVTVQKTYRDKEGKLQTTTTLDVYDILGVQYLLSQAFKFVNKDELEESSQIAEE